MMEGGGCMLCTPKGGHPTLKVGRIKTPDMKGSIA